MRYRANLIRYTLNRKGGDVLIAAQPVADVVSLNRNSDVEILCAWVKLADIYCYIICLHISPASEISLYLQHLRLLQEMSRLLESRDIIVVLKDCSLANILGNRTNIFKVLLF